MKDRFGRVVDTLRISVTHECQLRCCYCFTGECDLKDQQRSHHALISEKEIVDLVEYASTHLGITRIRFTGGEPLLRKELPSIIRSVSQIGSILDIALTTNGLLLSDKDLLRNLKESGLKRINVGIDSFDPDNFSKIVRRGTVESARKIIDQIKRGVLEAKEIGLFPIKINSVLGDWSDHRIDLMPITEWADHHGFIHQIIPVMDLREGVFGEVYYSPTGKKEEENRPYMSSGGKCQICRRLRVNAQGELKSCLFGDDNKFSIREFGIDKAFQMAMDSRVLCGGKKGQELYFFELGG